jgi:hypothetical protein
VLLFFYTDLADLFKYPVGWTNAIAGIKAERNDIPIDYKESYATTRSCGRSCDIVKIRHFLFFAAMMRNKTKSRPLNGTDLLLP